MLADEVFYKQLSTTAFIAAAQLKRLQLDHTRIDVAHVLTSFKNDRSP